MRKPKDMLKMILQDFTVEISVFFKKRTENLDKISMREVGDFIDKFMQEHGLDG